MTEQRYSDERFDLSKLHTAILVGVYQNKNEYEPLLEHLEELASLATTAGFEPVHTVPCSCRKFDAGTLIGEGKIAELAALEGDVVIFDDEITPNQQRNLEKLLAKPVIDRTELILEVFAQRAQTREARIQIELAKSRYILPRLRRLWTHLSRQSSGGGAHLKGEGESQIEIDRRLIKQRITTLKADLEAVEKNRSIQRHARIKSGIPTFGIVGYTNAGKSTLMKALTGADVLIEDKLFATLDTTTRKYILPNQQAVVVIDTVGFIRKIPHTLVAAFKSTLEETIHTDILLHVVDISSPHALEQAQATLEVLKELGADKKRIITVLNKVDLLENRLIVQKFRVLYPKTVAISAITKEGFEDLAQAMIEELKEMRVVVHLRLPQSQYGLAAEAMEKGKVLELDYEGNEILLRVEIPKEIEYKLRPYEII